VGLGLEQELTADLGVFSRLGFNDGATETWAFTESDRAISFGASLKGNSWARPNDVFGAALMFDWLSKDHADYLAAGGMGFMLGDGSLSYAPEDVAEVYYLWKVIPEVAISPDFQFIVNPGYNSARGPVPVAALRLHCEI
jgi:high affinity Mn2+ porin